MTQFNFANWWVRFRQRRAFSLPVRTSLYADLARFMHAGVAPVAVMKRSEAIARRRRKGYLADVYRRIWKNTEDGGMLFSDALAAEAPGSEGMMVGACGRASPEIFMQGLGELASMIRKQSDSRRKLQTTLRVGIGTLVAIVAISITMALVVAPQLEQSITPEMAATMSFAPTYFSAVTWLTHFGIFVAIAVVGLVVWARWSLANWQHDWRYWSRSWCDHHLLPWTFYARKEATFFLSAVAAMLRAGIPLQQSLNSMVKYASPWSGKHMRSMSRGLAAGRGYADVLGSRMLPDDVSDRLGTYSLNPDFTSVMPELAADNDATYSQKIDSLAGILRLAVLLVIAVFILTLGFAIFDFARSMMQLSRNLPT